MQPNLKIQKSFSDIYSIYYMKMLRFSRTYVSTKEDAENIVQDTFLYLWEHLELLEEIEHPDAFLFTLIKNRCLNFLKHQSYIQAKTCPLKADEELESQLNLYALQQFDEAVSSISEVEELLKQTMQKLPERCREIFLLSRIEGLKYKEIAERLDISVNTVENQISIALRKLKSELKEYIPLLIFII
ncbi:RNA polymerase sigma-70 factor [Bacteroides fluxus]